MLKFENQEIIVKNWFERGKECFNYSLNHRVINIEKADLAPDRLHEKHLCYGDTPYIAKYSSFGHNCGTRKFYDEENLKKSIEHFLTCDGNCRL